MFAASSRGAVLTAGGALTCPPGSLGSARPRLSQSRLGPGTSALLIPAPTLLPASAPSRTDPRPTRTLPAVRRPTHPHTVPGPASLAAVPSQGPHLRGTPERRDTPCEAPWGEGSEGLPSCADPPTAWKTFARGPAASSPRGPGVKAGWWSVPSTAHVTVNRGRRGQPSPQRVVHSFPDPFVPHAYSETRFRTATVRDADL